MVSRESREYYYFDVLNTILVVILNSRRRMGYSQWMRFVQEAVKNLVYNISLTSAATEKLDSWENGLDSVRGRWRIDCSNCLPF